MRFCCEKTARYLNMGVSAAFLLYALWIAALVAMYVNIRRYSDPDTDAPFQGNEHFISDTGRSTRRDSWMLFATLMLLMLAITISFSVILLGTGAPGSYLIPLIPYVLMGVVGAVSPLDLAPRAHSVGIALSFATIPVLFWYVALHTESAACFGIAALLGVGMAMYAGVQAAQNTQVVYGLDPERVQDAAMQKVYVAGMTIALLWLAGQAGTILIRVW